MTLDSATVLVTEAQRRQLDDQGYFITDVLFDPPTLGELRAEFQRLWDKHIAQAISGGAAGGGGDALTIEQARYRAFIAQLDRVSPVCDRFVRHPVMLGLCRQLIGPDADTTWNQTIIKAPMQGTTQDGALGCGRPITARKGGATPAATQDNAFGWHQDMWYATHGDYMKGTNPEVFLANESGFTAWAAISRTTVDNGTLWVLPGRHKEGLLPHVWDEKKREWSGQFDTSWRVPVVMRAGQMVVFRKYLPHGSGPNVSDEVRMAYQIGYSRTGMRNTPSQDLAPVLRGGVAVR